LRAFFVDDVRSRNIPPDLEARLFRRLQMIDDAVTDQDLRLPPSNHFEKLRGNRAGYYSIRVNQQWRLTFRWDGERGEADGICLDDHSESKATMLTTKRKPATVGEILTEEFMEPMGLTQGALAEAMGVQRKHVNELCGNRRNVTAATALILARVFGNSPDSWLNVQRRNDLWEVMNTPKERERIERARPLNGAA
jgi:addiction module HigA family antidote